MVGSRQLKVGLVLDPAGTEEGYNRGALLGIERAVAELGIKGRVLTPAPREGFGPSLSLLARQRYDLVIGLSVFAAGAVDAAAIEFPGTRFAIVDVPHEALAHRPQNVQGLSFRTEEAGYLAGYLAGRMVTIEAGEPVISAVGGEPVPAVRCFIAGYEAGARRANPDVMVLHGYTDDFLDRAKGRALALGQIAKGSRVVFQVAGASGRGVIDAAREQGVWAIGVDVDESGLGEHVLTSAVVRRDNSVLAVIGELVDGTLRTGGTSVFALRNGGVGLGAISPAVERPLLEELAAIEAEIAAGSVRIPTGVS